MRRTVALHYPAVALRVAGWAVCLLATLNFQLSTVSGQAVAPIVSGPAAEGSAPVRNPLWIAGKGADGFIHSVRTANDGTVRTDPSGTTTQPVSIASLAQLPAALDGSGNLKVHEQGTAAVSISDGSDATLGAKADAKSSATDTTPVTAMQVLKEISFMEQTPATRAVTQSGNWSTRLLDGLGNAITSDARGSGRPLAVEILDGSGNQITSFGGGGGDTASSATGSSVPANANYGGVNVGGTLRGATAVNPSGSIYAQQIDAASVAGTTIDTNSGNKSAGTQRVVIATDQPQLTNKLLVTPDSVALPANQSVNTNQVAGTTVDTNSGTKSAGTQRVVLATDQPQLTNKLLVTPDSVALPANQSVNTAQFGGTNVSTGIGAGGSGIPRVTISNDSSLAANQSVNVAQVAGSTTSTAATGVQKVGVVGNAGATLDGTVAAGSAPTNGVAILGQYKATAPAPADTQTLAPQLDQAGNTRINYGESSATLSVWNSSTSLNATQNIYSNSGATQTTIVLQQSAGTFSAGAITFEVTFDGTNWVAIPSTSVLDPTDTTLATIPLPYTLVTSTNKAFSIQSVGWVALRIKLSTAITGTGTVTPVYTLMPEGPGRPVTVASGGVGNNVNINKIGNTNVSQSGGNLGIDLERVAGNAVANAGSGIQKVAIVASNSNTFDCSRDGSTAPPNGIVAGGTYTVAGLSLASNFSTTLVLDKAGNLRTTPGINTGAATPWDTSTTINTTATIFAHATSTSGVPTILVNTVANAGTFTAGAITFEASFDGTNWSAIPADSVMDASSTSLAQIALPYTIVASTTKNFLIINRGWQGLRIKLSTAITGSSSPSLTFTPTYLPYQPYVHTDQDYIAGGAIATAATGVQKVGLVGNTGATLDSTIGAATAPANALVTGAVYQTTIPALTAGQAVADQTDTTGSLYVNTTGRSASYRMAVKSFTPVASATSPTFSIQGSASKTVRIMRIVVTTQALTGTGTPFKSDLVLQKYSALTGGTTGSTPTGTLMDGNNAAQTAVCLQYSAVPTTATAIGGLVAAELIQQISATATANGTTRNEFTFGDKGTQGLVLRGTAQYLGITINPLGTTPLMSVWIEWVEDNS